MLNYILSNEGKHLTEHRTYGIIPPLLQYTVVPNASCPLTNEELRR